MTVPPHSICLDVQGAQNAIHLDRGIPRFVVEHARALAACDPHMLHSVLLSPQRPLTGNVNWLLGSGLLAWATGDRRPTRRPRSEPSIYHVMSPFELDRPLDELWPQWARSPAVRTVVTLYDLIPLVFAEHYLRDPVIRDRYLTRTRLVAQAERVFAISQTTANDAVERLGVPAERVTVIEAGATSAFATMFSRRAHAESVLATALPELRPGFLLYVGGFEFRKNLERLIRAYGLLARETRARHQLVIACRLLESERELLRGLAIDAEIATNELLLTGYVSDTVLGALYHACELFVFPSFYEGSGLPILEAMSCGVPVLAANTSTGPEILGDLEGTFDPMEPAAIAQAIADALASPEQLVRLAERSRRRAGSFTWRRVAERTIAGYEQTLAPRRRKPRRRLALVTPWPPEQSGIADYSFRLARELGHDVDVDVVVGGPLSDYAEPLESGLALVPASSFSAYLAVRQPDRILYCMGNSSFHRHVYELLRTRPGALLAHDVRLTGFYGWFAGLESPDAPALRLRERIEAQYGTRLPASLLDGVPNPERQSALGIFMTREIQQYAEEVFVHSRFARDVLELDRGLADRDVRVSVLPFALPPALASSPRPAAEGPLLVTVGVVSEVKGLATAIDAMSTIAAEWPHARLAIAGPGPERELERWREYARTRAPEANVEVTGYLEEAALLELLAAADVAVQLRTVSNGEASAAVADCLAAGLPTIATAVGWIDELPDEAVEKVALGADAPTVAARMQLLLGDGARRQALSNSALAYARANDFAAVATRYLEALELA